MTKSQIIIVIIAIIAVIFLFNLPKFVVRDSRQEPAMAKGITPSPDSESHNTQIPIKELKLIDNLRNSYLSISDKEKKIIFADSLAAVFRIVNKFDSSAKYIGEIAVLNSSNERLIK